MKPWNAAKAAVRHRLDRLPLNRKLVLLILLCIVPLTAASFASIRLVQRAEDRMLYQALAGSLAYSAADISQKLSGVEELSNAIISNKIISRSLIALADEENEIARANARSTLTSQLFDYHQSNRSSSISYIALATPDGLISSYESQSSAIPQAAYDTVIAAAGRNSGYTCWVTDYAGTYGLFLGRNSRRIRQMKFETLGTLVIGIDMERLIRTATQSILMSDQAYFVFYEEGRVLYTSRGLELDDPAAVQAAIPGQYAALRQGGRSYFGLRGTLESTGWDYVCLIPYDNIADSLRFSIVFSLAIVLLTAVLAILLARWIIGNLTRHFSSLIYKMEEFGRNESVLPATDYDYSARRDEIGLLHNQFDRMAQKIQQLIRENYINEILAKDAKLKALENQINPHFLYNTLESVNWRAKASGEKEISIMVEALGALLRTTLSHKSTTCTLEHELEIVRHYIAIQRLRFEERLDYRENLDPAVLSAQLPQLTIQPLVENAINYVLEEVADTCVIEVRGLLDGGRILVQVINTGSQFQPDMLDKLERGVIVPHGFGIGLLNIHKRIQLIYGGEFGLSLYNSDEDHAVAQICIPRRNYD